MWQLLHALCLASLAAGHNFVFIEPPDVHWGTSVPVTYTFGDYLDARWWSPFKYITLQANLCNRTRENITTNVVNADHLSFQLGSQLVMQGCNNYSFLVWEVADPNTGATTGNNIHSKVFTIVNSTDLPYLKGSETLVVSTSAPSGEEWFTTTAFFTPSFAAVFAAATSAPDSAATSALALTTTTASDAATSATPNQTHTDSAPEPTRTDAATASAPAQSTSPPPGTATRSLGLGLGLGLGIPFLLATAVAIWALRFRARRRKAAGSDPARWLATAVGYPNQGPAASEAPHPDQPSFKDVHFVQQKHELDADLWRRELDADQPPQELAAA